MTKAWGGAACQLRRPCFFSVLWLPVRRAVLTESVYIVLLSMYTLLAHCAYACAYCVSHCIPHWLSAAVCCTASHTGCQPVSHTAPLTGCWLLCVALCHTERQGVGGSQGTGADRPGPGPAGSAGTLTDPLQGPEQQPLGPPSVTLPHTALHWRCSRRSFCCRCRCCCRHRRASSSSSSWERWLDGPSRGEGWAGWQW